MNCGDWIDQFKTDHFNRGGTETTWRTEYWKMLKHLPPSEFLTANLLHELVLSTKVNTRTRKRACMVCGAIARFAKLDYNPSPYSGKYSPKSVSPRTIPSDELIIEWFDRLKNPGWRWVYAMLATYGIRSILSEWRQKQPNAVGNLPSLLPERLVCPCPLCR